MSVGFILCAHEISIDTSVYCVCAVPPGELLHQCSHGGGNLHLFR